ncbi:MAG: ParB N-terminal domain-containing protein [Acidobacteriota bacterium]|nr:ParB N-terminal domain-containing protein [Acidobacteriota bacterium]
MTVVKAAFQPQLVKLRLKALSTSREFHPRERKDAKYQQIAVSLNAVGLIEPLVVFPTGGGYRILDGHKRLDILIGRKVEEVECLIATKDEAYTYNRRVNYLSTIGEHQMILRALRHNNEETIAKALNLDVPTIRRKRTLLDGICKEAVDALKDRRVSPKSFATLRKMKPVRQLAAAQLMIASNRYSQKFSLALLAGTSDEMLVNPDARAKHKSLSAEQRARLVVETDNLLENVKAVESSYGAEALTLSVCCRYVNRLLSNVRVSTLLRTRHADVLEELQSLVSSFHEESALSAKV